MTQGQEIKNFIYMTLKFKSLDVTKKVNNY